MSEQVFIGVGTIALTIGLVQFVKEMLNLDGKPVTAMTMIVGTIVSAWFYALGSNLVTGVFYDLSVVVVTGVAGGLAAAGYYKLNRDNRATYYVTETVEPLITVYTKDLDDLSEM